LIAAGTIGEVISINSGFTHMDDFTANFRSNESQGGGMLLDLGCYPISAATYLLDLPVLTSPLVLERESEVGGVEMHLKAAAALGDVSLTVTVSSKREASCWFDVLGSSGSLSLAVPAFSSAPESIAGTELFCNVDGEIQEWHVPASDPRSLMLSETAGAVLAKRNGTDPEWSFNPSAKISILTAHAIDILRNAENPAL
jgi:predicted dehydrogenase